MKFILSLLLLTGIISQATYAKLLKQDNRIPDSVQREVETTESADGGATCDKWTTAD